MPSGLTGRELFKEYTKNTARPLLIGYYRCGNHWLMTCLNEYTGKKIVSKNGNKIFYPGRCGVDTVLVAHSHDESLTATCSNVIYLWREDIASVVFSFLYASTGEKDLHNLEKILSVTKRYSKHVKKWISKLCKKKTVVTYEQLSSHFNEHFGRVLAHLGVPCNTERIVLVRNKVTKDFVRQKVKGYNKRVMLRGVDYEALRTQFRLNYSDVIRRSSGFF